MTIEQQLIVMLGEQSMRIAQLLVELAASKAKEQKPETEPVPEGQA